MRTQRQQPFPIGLAVAAAALVAGGLWFACTRGLEPSSAPPPPAASVAVPELSLPAPPPAAAATKPAPLAETAAAPEPFGAAAAAPPAPERDVDEGEATERTEAAAAVVEPPPSTTAGGAKLAEPSRAFPEIARLVPLPAKRLEARVARVVDGDTIELDDGTKVRFVGVNTPERTQPLYEEARAFTASLVAARRVYYTTDEEERDSYGRELAYIFTEDGRFVNGELVRRGLAFVYTWEPNTRYKEEFLKLQRAAREDGLGLWSLPPPPPCPGGYVSERRSHIFHRPECRSAKKIPPAERTTWTARVDALDTGRNPCRTCKP